MTNGTSIFKKIKHTNDRIKRLEKKNLSTILLEKFLNEYGYEKGIVAARAFVKDIIETVNKFYIDTNKLQPGQMLWIATDKNERQAKGKTLENTKKKVIKLTLVDQKDIYLLKKKYKCFKEIQKQRTIRLIKEAYKQNTVLTIDDLLILLSINAGYIDKWIQEYQKENKEILPIRGNIADIGPGLTHKRQIIELYVKGLLTSEIARKTNHSEVAADRYITDYEKIKILKEQNFTPEKISFLIGKGLSVVKQYMEFI